MGIKKQRHHHILKQNDDLNMPVNYIFFDTETGKEKFDETMEKQTLKLGWLRHINTEKNIDNYVSFSTPKEFWDYVEGSIHKNTLYVIAHNIDFDYRIVDGLNQMHILRDWKYGKSYIEGATYILEMMKGKEKVIFYDTMNYAQKSLEEIGESLNIPKMKIDFDTCTMDELSIYCKNDVLIVSEFMLRQISFLTVQEMTKIRPTSASTAFNAFRHKYYDIVKHPIHIHAYPDVTRAERRSYKGGICDCFKVGKFDDKLVKLDITSMYPYIMRTYDVPVKIRFREQDITVERLKELMKEYHVIADCDITLSEEYAYILTHAKYGKSKKCMFIKGDIEGTYCTPELQYIIEYGRINRIREAFIYDKDLIFRNFVDDLFALRKKYDQEKNKVFSDFCKMLMNSLYGKFGAYDIDDVEIVRKDGTSFKKDISYKKIMTIDGSFMVMHVGGQMRMLRKSDENAFESFPAISSMITAYARMYLVEMIMKVGRENVYYMDTDCIIINADKMHLISDYIDRHWMEGDKTVWAKEIGKLKIEGYSDYSEFIRPKNYKFGGDIKCKGVKKDVFKTEGKKKDSRNRIVSESDDELKIEQVHFERHKTAMRKGNLDNVMVSIMKKTISKRYDKGHVIDGIVHPYDSKEVELCIMKAR